MRPLVLTVTWVVYKNRSSIKLYWRGREARNFTIAHAGRSQHRSCANNTKKLCGKPNCNWLKRKPLVTNAIPGKPPPFSWRLRTRSWDVHEESIMPNPGRARGFVKRCIRRRTGEPGRFTSSANAPAKASPWRSQRSSCTRRAPCWASRRNLRGSAPKQPASQTSERHRTA